VNKMYSINSLLLVLGIIVCFAIAQFIYGFVLAYIKDSKKD